MNRILIFFLTLILLFLPQHGNAETPHINKEIAITDFSTIARLPVKYAAQYLRYDNFAKKIVTTLLESKTPDKLNATEWLTQLIFDDPRAFNVAIFSINNTIIKNKLKLPDKTIFTLNELLPYKKEIDTLYKQTIQINKEYRGDNENDIINVYEKLHLALNLTQSFSFAIATTSFKLSELNIKKELNIPLTEQYFSYLDIVLVANKLIPYFDQLGQKDRDTWTTQDEEVFLIVKNLYLYAEKQNKQSALRIIPHSSQTVNWLNPTEFINNAITTQNDSNTIILLNNLYTHAVAGNQEEFDWTINKLLDYNKTIYASSPDQAQINAAIKNNTQNKEKTNFAYLIIFLLIFAATIILVIKNK